MEFSFFRGSKRASLMWAVTMIALIAVIDWRVVGEMPLGFLYLLPMAMLGRVLKPWQTTLAAALCTVLTEEFDTFAWNVRNGLPRDVLYFAAFLSVGVFVYEMDRNRQIILRQLHEIEEQSDARREAEEQLTVLIESSPAAIITADADGTVLMANEAAHRMLAVKAPLLLGRSIHRYLPSLVNISSRQTTQPLFRTVMQLPHGVGPAAGGADSGFFRGVSHAGGIQPAPDAGGVAHRGQRGFARDSECVWGDCSGASQPVPRRTAGRGQGF
jgi:two-component system sensor kinase FixL